MEKGRVVEPGPVSQALTDQDAFLRRLSTNLISSMVLS